MTEPCRYEYLAALENEIIDLSEELTRCHRHIKKCDELLLAANPDMHHFFSTKRAECVLNQEEVDRALTTRLILFGNIRGCRQKPIPRLRYNTSTRNDCLLLGDIFYFHGKEAYELELAIRKVAMAARAE